MSDKLLSSKDVAVLLSTTSRTAADILKMHGLSPVNIGRGRKAVYRWSESAVQQMINGLHRSQQKKPAKRITNKKTQIDLSTISIDELYTMTLTEDAPSQ